MLENLSLIINCLLSMDDRHLETVLGLFSYWSNVYKEDSISKSSIEIAKCTSSNILVWFGRDAPEKSVAGLRESLISSPFENFQKD